MMTNTELGVDYQVLFNWAVGVVGILIGVIMTVIWNAIKEMQHADKELTEKVASIEVLVAGKYISRVEYREDMGKVFGKLDTIIDVMSSKADR